MNTININTTYGPIISDKIIGDKIYNDIKNILDNDSEVLIDLKDVIAMATFCAKQIFGKLFINLGQEMFSERVLISNASQDLKIIINMGIQSAIEEKKK